MHKKQNLSVANLMPFAPHKLNLLIEGVVCELEGFDLHIKDTVIAERVNYKLEDVKPILQPLSSLDEDNASFLSGNGYLGVCEESHLHDSLFTEELSYSDTMELVKRHYDIDNLINRGLAVDINTLKQNKDA